MSWEDEPIAQVDMLKLGEAALKLPLLAVQLGHASLQETDAYLHADTPEARFVVDLMMLSRGKNRGMGTEEFCERWFGGMAGARKLFGAMVEQPHTTLHEVPQIPHR